MTACGAVRGAVLASYRHETGLRGTGHARGCLVFDARTGNREATLAAGAGTGGGWGASPCALHADDRKVVCVGGDVAAVFDTRTWTATSEIRMGWGERRVSRRRRRGARDSRRRGRGGETRAFEANVGRRLSVVESPWGSREWWCGFAARARDEDSVLFCGRDKFGTSLRIAKNEDGRSRREGTSC